MVRVGGGDVDWVLWVVDVPWVWLSSKGGVSVAWGSLVRPGLGVWLLCGRAWCFLVFFAASGGVRGLFVCPVVGRVWVGVVRFG